MTTRNGLVPSQLRISDAEKILANGSRDRDEFMDSFVVGRNIMEVAGGGNTDLVAHFLEMGALSAVTTDIVRKGRGQNPCLYLRADLNDLRSRVGEIKKKLFGNLPDTIVGTSFFGAPSLSRDETVRWLKECSGIVAPGGVIIVDFQLLTWFVRRCAWLCSQDYLTQQAFDAILDELTAERIIRCWHRAKNASPRMLYRYGPVLGCNFPIGPRLRSMTYRIFPCDA